MKQALQKSRIPEEKAFVVNELKAPNFDTNWHFHPEYQLFLVLKGKGIRFIGDDMRPFHENDLVFTGPNLPHLWRNDNSYLGKSENHPTHGLVIYFSGDFLGNAIGEKKELESIHLLFQRSIRGLEVKGVTNQRIQKMMWKLLKLKGGESIIQLLKILNLLANSEECHPIAKAGYINLNKESEKDRMGQVYEFIMDNFNNKICLEEVAAVANMSLSAFSRYFKSRVNKSYSEFLAEVRISHACKLLKEGQWNISQVSYECGYNTLSNFNHQFREKMGVTPLGYRKNFKTNF